MHTVLSLSSLLLVVFVGLLALAGLRRLSGWARRRDLQLVVLAAPLVSLGVAIGGLHHFAGQVCYVDTPPWDYTLGSALPLGMGLVALGALGLGLVRLGLMGCLAAGASVPASLDLQAHANRLALQLGAAQPTLRLRAHNRPLALTWGLRRPAVLLSTWMLTHLDGHELEAVLAHELGHVARRDALVGWLALVLRDAFCYLPTSWVAYHQLQQEKEMACDELAASATRRPLALASALAKVWQQAVEHPRVGIAQPLVEAGEAIERRIERLLALPDPVADPAGTRLALLGGTTAVVGLLVLEVANLAVMLTPMGCGPAALFGHLL